MIQVGDTIPSVPAKLVANDEIVDTTSDAVLGEGTVVFFTVPGAFTPTCHVNHLPGFISNAVKLRAAGVTRIVCGAVNDAHVLKAWAQNTSAVGVVEFLADGNGALAEAMGLSKDLSGGGMGRRFGRSAMLIKDGTVQHIFVEDKPGVSGSGAPAILMALQEDRGVGTLGTNQ